MCEIKIVQYTIYNEMHRKRTSWHKSAASKYCNSSDTNGKDR